MKILFLGDVTGRSGRDAVAARLRSLKEETAADFTVINGENAAHGKGITSSIYHQLISSGADVITLGNHAFSKSEILAKWQECPNLIRPANLLSQTAGSSYVIRTCGEKRIAVVNLLGTVFMDGELSDPFEAMEQILEQLDADLILVDFHAEATSEKELFLRLFSDQVTAVIGTHTHVQTADEQIYHGCAYISDAGMCGPFDSILGRDIDEVIQRRFDGIATRYLPSDAPAVICGVLIETDEVTNRAIAIHRIQERPQ